MTGNKNPREQTLKMSTEGDGYFSSIVAKSLKDRENDDGVTVKGIDYANVVKLLEADGVIVENKAGKFGTRCQMFRPYTAEERVGVHPDATDEDCRRIIADGYGLNQKEALMLAVFGTVREEHAKHNVAKTLAAKEVKVDEKLHAELERRFILEGGQQRLDADIAQMVTQKQDQKAGA